MTILLYLLAGAGSLVVLAILALLVYGFMTEIGDRMNRNNTLTYESGRRQAFSEIKSASWWFSEDVPTMNMLAGLSEDRAIYGVREQWRKETGRDKKAETRSE